MQRFPQCPQAAVTGTLHQPHVQAKISQVGDQTILASNKGWTNVLPKT